MKRQTNLGENKAISLLTYEEDKGTIKLGAMVLIPVRQEADKTYYKPLGIEVPITEAQRNEIIKMLGGIPPCQS